MKVRISPDRYLKMITKEISIFIAVAILAPTLSFAEVDRGLLAAGRGDFKKAFEEFNECSPEPACQRYLGEMYEYGRGVTRDEKQAFYWYQKAADQGLASAQNNLGVLYLNGRGVAKDSQQAFYWYQKSADQGNAHGQYNLGVMYKNGQSVSKDDAKAVDLYEKAARQGHALAQLNLGFMYSEGLGVQRNLERATYWAARSAQQGVQQAIINLNSYKSGLSPIKTTVTALSMKNFPSSEGKTIEILPKGTVLYKLGEANGYTEIYSSKRHLLGFVESKYISNSLK